MTCHEIELELGDYVDGTLGTERVGAVESHVRTCAQCRSLVTDFTAIRGAARTLDPQMPEAHVWTHIAAALTRDQHAAAVESVQRTPPWWRLSTGALAWKPLLAAVVMVVVLTGATWAAWHDASTRVGGFQASAGAPVHGEMTLAPEVQLAEQGYSKAIGDLEKVTQEQGGSLDPETAKVMTANLAVIDQAIDQSRDALKTEPANPTARESLFGALRSKVQLLQDTVALINEMRKGNQEGAARIMSGMNP
jgi:predicted ribosomally synthesized peptide with SipW-like signal peptide